MTAEMQNELINAIHSDSPLEQIVTLLRRFRDAGSTRDEVYSFLTGLYQSTSNEEEQDRIADVSDFVAGFCSPHMKIWEDGSEMKSAR